jgi:hypothetical protein
MPRTDRTSSRVGQATGQSEVRQGLLLLLLLRDRAPTAGLSCGDHLIAATTYRPNRGSSPAPTHSNASWTAVTGATASRM